MTDKVKILAVEAIRRGQETLDYYIKEQGWSEAYAREHAEVVFDAGPVTASSDTRRRATLLRFLFSPKPQQ